MPSRREVYIMENRPTFGASRLSESRFSTFRDGDIKVIVTGSHQCQLHKSIFENSSPFFRGLLFDEHPITLLKKAKKTARRRGMVIPDILRARGRTSCSK